MAKAKLKTAAPTVQTEPFRAFEVMGLGAVMFRLMGPTVAKCCIVYEPEAVDFANEHGIELIRYSGKLDSRLPQNQKQALPNG